MGLSKYFWTTTLVYYISVCSITSQRTEEDKARSRLAKKCMKQCGGVEKLLNADESWVCCDPAPESNKPFPHITSNCMVECTGKPPCDNSLECLCEVCKRIERPESDTHLGMCSKRGEVHVLKKDCDELVCTGKVPWRGVKNCKRNADDDTDLPY